MAPKQVWRHRTSSNPPLDVNLKDVYVRIYINRQIDRCYHWYTLCKLPGIILPHTQLRSICRWINWVGTNNVDGNHRERASGTIQPMLITFMPHWVLEETCFETYLLKSSLCAWMMLNWTTVLHEVLISVLIELNGRNASPTSSGVCAELPSGLCLRWMLFTFQTERVWLAVFSRT